MKNVDDGEKLTSATVRAKTLKKLHAIKRRRRLAIYDIVDDLAERELAIIRKENASTVTTA